MAVTTYRCPACGNGLRYDPELQKLVCDYCHNQYYEHEILDLIKEKELSTANTNLYHCPSCGAEVATNETTAATYCYYCHNPVVLSGRLRAEFRPDYVLPFKVTKDQARKNFLNWVQTKRYIPKGFYSDSNIEKITGVYYPYWMADYTLDSTFSGEGKESTTVSDGNYNVVTTKHYDVVRRGDVELRNVQRGALSTADRKLSDGVHPYDYSQMQPFSETALTGFQAEKRDVNSEDLHQSIEEEMKSYAQNLLTEGHSYSSLSGETVSQVKDADFSYALLPAWVITYTGRDGVIYYYSINGQNQKTCGVLPIDKGKLKRDAFAIFAVVAGLLAIGGMFIW